MKKPIPRKRKKYSTKMTRRQAKAVRLRLQGNSLEDIASKLGISYQAVQARLKGAKSYTHERTAAKISQRAIPSEVLEKQRPVIQAFWNEFSDVFTPGQYVGIINRLGRKLNLSVAIVSSALKGAGIIFMAELNRKKLDFFLAVEETIKFPFEEAVRELGCKRRTLVKYRQLLRKGKHLQIGIDSVNLLERKGWWDTKSYAARRTSTDSRDKKVKKDLELLKQLINSKFAETKQKRTLQQTKNTYIKREQAFRKKKGIPLISELKKN